MHLFYFIITFFLFAGSNYGQQRPQLTQYMLNKYYENPAYGGLERSLSVFTSYRDQYSTLAGNPKTFYLGADMPFYLWSGALGFSLYNQKTGVFSNTNVKFSYNYVQGTNFGFLSFGGRLGLDMLNINGAGIITPDGVYEGVFNHNDPFLSTSDFGGLGLTWEVGTYFRGQDIQAGITIGELPTHSYSIGEGVFAKSFYGSAFVQYSYFLPNDMELIPSLLVRKDAAVFQIDVGIMTSFSESLFGGLNIRGYNMSSLDAIGLIIGTSLGKKYKISYSFDFGLSALNHVNQGSHEIMLSYNLQKLIGLGLPSKIIYNPRDL